MGEMSIHLLGKILDLLKEPVLEKDGCTEIVVGSTVLWKVFAHHRSRIQFPLKDVNLVQEQNHGRLRKELMVRDMVEQHQTLL